jgi:hypothetical protein
LHRIGYRYNTKQQTGVERFEDALSKPSSARITYDKLTINKLQTYLTFKAAIKQPF